MMSVCLMVIYMPDIRQCATRFPCLANMYGLFGHWRRRGGEVSRAHHAARALAHSFLFLATSLSFALALLRIWASVILYLSSEEVDGVRFRVFHFSLRGPARTNLSACLPACLPRWAAYRTDGWRLLRARARCAEDWLEMQQWCGEQRDYLWPCGRIVLCCRG